MAVVVLALGLKEEKQERGRQVKWLGCPAETELVVVLLVSECLMGMVVRREGWMR